MKTNLVSNIKLLFGILVLSFFTDSSQAQIKTKINPAFAGLNFWGTNYEFVPTGAITTPLSSTTWTYAQATNAKMMRVGGRAYNNHTGNNYSAPRDANNNIVPSGYVRLYSQ